MGANLLSTPDLLCDILVKLRTTLPQNIAVSAKIRLLPSQEDTLALVKRVVSTGISCLTVHCRTKDMRKGEPALIHRLREIVEFVEGLGLGIPVIANGDCSSRDDAVRLRDVTGGCNSISCLPPINGRGCHYSEDANPLSICKCRCTFGNDCYCRRKKPIVLHPGTSAARCRNTTSPNLFCSCE